MGQIKVKVESYANNSVVDEIKQAASASLGKSVGATVIKDAAGKVVEVLVGIPSDVDATGLETARAAIDANHGVAKATATPIEITGDLNSMPGSPDDPVSSITFANGQVVSLSPFLTPPSPDCEWQVSATAEASGGSGKALRLTDKTTAAQFSDLPFAFWNMASALRVDPGLNGIAGAITGFKMKFDIKMAAVDGAQPAEGSGANQLDFNRAEVLIPGFEDSNCIECGLAFSVRVFRDKTFGANWFYTVTGPGGVTNVDSGVAASSYLTVDVTFRQSGIFTWKIGASAVTTINMGFDTSMSSNQGMVAQFTNVCQGNLFSSVPAFKQRAILVDNLDLQVLDTWEGGIL